MKKREYEKHRDRVLALAKKWNEHLGLNWWRKFEIVYYKAGKDVPKIHKKAAMWTTISWQYSSAEVAINVPRIATMGDEELEWAWFHELMHVFVNQMRPAEGSTKAETKNEEFVCSRLASAFLWWTAHLRGKSR